MRTPVLTVAQRSFAAVTHIAVDFLSAFLKLAGQLIGAGTCFLRGGFGASQRFFSSLLGAVTQLNGFILDYGTGLLTGLWGEQ